MHSCFHQQLNSVTLQVYPERSDLKFLYLHEMEQLFAYMDKAEISKEVILQYRSYLSAQYKAGTVNGKLSAVHSYLEFMNLDMCKVKFLKVQKRMPSSWT